MEFLLLLKPLGMWTAFLPAQIAHGLSELVDHEHHPTTIEKSEGDYRQSRKRFLYKSEDDKLDIWDMQLKNNHIPLQMPNLHELLWFFPLVYIFFYTAKLLFHQSPTRHSDNMVAGQWWCSHCCSMVTTCIICSPVTMLWQSSTVTTLSLWCLVDGW